MNIAMTKTLTQIQSYLDREGTAGIEALHKMYDLTIKLQSQLLGIIYDMETYRPTAGQERLASLHSSGQNQNGIVTLTIDEPLPSMKRLTEVAEEHWKAMIHAAIDEAARQGPLPYFEKAVVEITIVTPRGANNARVWDTSNRAINLVINNLKGIFFEDDNFEHMAFSVMALWGKKGVTILRITNRGELEQSGENEF